MGQFKKKKISTLWNPKEKKPSLPGTFLHSLNKNADNLEDRKIPYFRRVLQII